EDGPNYDSAGPTCPPARIGLPGLVLQQLLRFTHCVERFSSSRGVSGIVKGGFFLREKPLSCPDSLYSNWRTAIASPSSRHQGDGNAHQRFIRYQLGFTSMGRNDSHIRAR